MNKYEQRTERERQPIMRMPILLWTAAAALIILVLYASGFLSAAPSRFWKSAAIVAAVLLLAFRQISRQVNRQGRRPIQPDTKSRLNLD